MSQAQLFRPGVRPGRFLHRAVAPIVAFLLALPAGPGVAAEAALAAAPPTPVPLRLFAQLPHARSGSLSPDGRHLAYLSSAEGRTSVVIRKLPIDDQSVTRLPAVDGPFDFYWVRWFDNQRLIVGMAAVHEGGFEGDLYYQRGHATRLFAFDLETGKLSNLIRPIKATNTATRIPVPIEQAHIQDRVIDWGRPGEPYIQVAILDDPVHSSGLMVRRIDVRSGEFTHVQGSVRDVSEWFLDRQGVIRLGRWFAGRDQVRRGSTYADPQTGEWKEFEGPLFHLLGYDFLAFEADPRFALVSAPVQGRISVARWNLPENRIESVVYSDPDSDVERPIYAGEDHRDLLGVELADGRTVFFDATWKRTAALIAAALPGTRIDIESMSADRRTLLLLDHSATEPGAYYVLDLATRKMYVAAYSYEAIEPALLAPVRSVHYAARDGLDIPALLTVPAGPSRPRAAVVLVHGGPWTHDKGDHFDWLAQFLANRGYLVLQPQFRGSTGFGQAFLDAGDRQWGLKMQDDLDDGAAWMVAQGLADPARIAIVGGSYGGYAALEGATRIPHVWRCAVSLNGVSDLPSLLQDRSNGLRDEMASQRIGDPSVDHDQLERTSPLRLAPSADIPVLLVHARDDTRVNFSQSQRMHAALQAAGKSSTLVVLDRGDHTLTTEASRRGFLEALEAFLQKEMPPG